MRGSPRCSQSAASRSAPNAESTLARSGMGWDPLAITISRILPPAAGDVFAVTRPQARTIAAAMGRAAFPAATTLKGPRGGGR